MTIDIATVTKIAHLARIKVPEEDKPLLAEQLDNILEFVQQLNEVNIEGVTPMTGSQDMGLRMRNDVVNDGGKPQDILANAPGKTEDFFVVPKVVE